MSSKIDKFVSEFQEVLRSPNSSVGIAVIRVLTNAITESSATTFMGVDQELSELIDAIEKACPNLPMHFRGAAQVFRAAMSKASEARKEDWKKLFLEHMRNSHADVLEALEKGIVDKEQTSVIESEAALVCTLVKHK